MHPKVWVTLGIYAIIAALVGGWAYGYSYLLAQLSFVLVWRYVWKGRFECDDE